MNTYTLFSQNGMILPIDAAQISLLNIEYSYGYGVYETLKVRNNITYFIDQHLERLEFSATILGIPMPFTRQKIKQFIVDLVTTSAADSCNIKIVLIGGETPVLSIFITSPLFPDKKLYTQGTHLITYEYERMFPTAKTLNMLPSYIAYKKAVSAGAYDALLLDRNGIMLEGTRTNFCVVTGKTIYQAPKHRVLGGVTYFTLAHLAKMNGFSLIEKEIPITELSRFDGAFITSTSTKIMPVKTIDTFSYPNIPLFILELMKLYNTFLDTSKGEFSF